MRFEITSFASSLISSPDTIPSSTVPFVMVPVLSKTTVLAFPRFSKAVAFLIRIHSCAPLPVPTIMATGVASPSAQGHEITKTEIPNTNGAIFPSSKIAS